MQSSDFAFANDIRAAVELRTPRTARLLLFAALALLFDRGRLVADGPRDKVIAMLQGGPRRPPAPAPP